MKCENCENCPSEYIPVKRLDFKLYEKYHNDFSSVSAKKGTGWQKYKYVVGLLEFMHRKLGILSQALETQYQDYSDIVQEKFFKVATSNDEDPRIDKIVNELKVADENVLLKIEEILNIATFFEEDEPEDLSVIEEADAEAFANFE